MDPGVESRVRTGGRRRFTAEEHWPGWRALHISPAGEAGQGGAVPERECIPDTGYVSAAGNLATD